MVVDVNENVGFVCVVEEFVFGIVFKLCVEVDE